jgi:hypothetical protein
LCLLLGYCCLFLLHQNFSRGTGILPVCWFVVPISWLLLPTSWLLLPISVASKFFPWNRHPACLLVCCACLLVTVAYFCCIKIFPVEQASCLFVGYCCLFLLHQNTGETPVPRNPNIPNILSGTGETPVPRNPNILNI